MTDLTRATATELSKLYQSGTASPVAVAEQVLHKIAQVNPVINAFCFTDSDTTMAQARASEARWQQGQPLSELDGVPVAIKDSILTQGWPTLHGSKTVDPGQDWSEDSPVSARLQEAGAVFVGKTATTEFGWGDNRVTRSDLHGITRNPWNRDYTTGGSSGGSAAAVAAGLVPLAIGSDMGGSICIPSAFCGVMGLKPNAGRVPRYPSDAIDIITLGPMARTVSDLVLAMNIITQLDVREWSSLPVENYSLDPDFSMRNLRVAYCQTVGVESVDPDILATVDQVAHWMASQGAKVESVKFDSNALEIFQNLHTPETLQKWLDIPVDRQHLTGRDFQRVAVLAKSKFDLYQWLVHRKHLIVKMQKFMQLYDVILSPVTVITADKILVDNVPPAGNDFAMSPFSRMYCVTQQPSISVPVGLTKQSIPAAVQIGGAMRGDALVLQVAHAIEKQFPMPLCPVIL
jgi:aspartyl-tRNA(Asn)/glutamyl-tRNA(Gln) amidotransferase subunit A